MTYAAPTPEAIRAAIAGDWKTACAWAAAAAIGTEDVKAEAEGITRNRWAYALAEEIPDRAARQDWIECLRPGAGWRQPMHPKETDQ